jgi:hypothetical protein
MWDRQVDFLVFGGGCGGMTAALVAANERLEVLLCEKTSLIGGTTAISGGAIWVPGTSQSRLCGAPDSVDAARKYLEGELKGFDAPELREAFLQAGAEAVDYLEKHTEVKFKANNPYPDYHAERPGGALGGRTLAPLPFDGRMLGRDFELVRPPMREITPLGGMMVGRDEIAFFVRPLGSFKAIRLTSRLVARHLLDRLRYSRGTRLLLGNALVGRLLYSLRAKGAAVAVNARLVELIRAGDAVEGAVVDFGGKRERVLARRAVVLATGGCAASSRWRAELVKDIAIPYSLVCEGDSGDGLDAALGIGASLDRNHADPFFWMPASTIRWPGGRSVAFPHIRDRPKPGLIAVNSAGRRFVNEAASYHDFTTAMFHSHRSVPSIPAYLICDRRFLREYGLGVVYPVWQRVRRFVELGYLISAPTLEGLAAKINVDAGALVESVGEHNEYAKTGVDEAFGKGSTALNRFNGDRQSEPNPCLRPISTSPFFALPVYPAPLGSSLGLRTGVNGEVLDGEGRTIKRLYAAGNDMSSMMRGFYPGPGITLGPALVFAYRSAMHVAGKPLRP